MFESMLWIAGVRPALTDHDPFVGFESSVPLFEEQTDQNQAIMRTAANKLDYFNQQEFPKQKSDNSFRIFCLGGSTTFGRPYDDRTSFAGWLRELLPQVESDQEWEVINAGGISYASYRVAAVMEELVQYSPDLFVIYAGHNEFLEDRTYENIKESSSLWRKATKPLYQTHTFSLARRLLAPEHRVVEGATILPEEVDAILDHSVGPEAYHRNDIWQDQVVSHFEFNLTRMIRMAQSVGAEVILVKPAANMKDFSPFKSEHLTGLNPEQQQAWEDLLSRATGAAAAGEVDRGLALLREAEQIDSRPASLHYLRGKLLFAKQDFAAAQVAFASAIDEDVCPLRAISAIRQGIERVTIAERAMLVDFESILTSDCLANYGHSSPGHEYFLDHVHPTISGHRLLALAIIQALVRRGTAAPGSQWGDNAITLVSQQIESGIDADTQSRALTNLAQVLSWAGKQDEAGPLARLAVELRAAERLDDDPESMYYAAVSLAMQGQDAEATRLFKRVVELQPTHVDAIWRLAVLFYEQMQFHDAVVEFRRALQLNPEDAYSHQMLGATFMKLHRYDDAIVAFEHAAELDPTAESIQLNISAARAKIGGG